MSTLYMNLKRRLILGFLILPIILFSQFDQSIDIVAGIEYSYRRLSTTSEDDLVLRIKEMSDAGQSGKMNWRFGFNYNRKILKRIHLKTGLRLASVGYNGEKKTDLTWITEFDEMGNWTPDPNLAREAQIIRDYWFVTMPIAGRFEMNENRLSPFIELGVFPTYYVTTRTKVITDLETTTGFNTIAASRINKLNVVSFISVGMNYSLSDTFQMFAQPIFRYHLTPLANKPIKTNLFNYGIELGVRRKLN